MNNEKDSDLTAWLCSKENRAEAKVRRWKKCANKLEQSFHDSALAISEVISRTDGAQLSGADSLRSKLDGLKKEAPCWSHMAHDTARYRDRFQSAIIELMKELHHKSK